MRNRIMAVIGSALVAVLVAVAAPAPAFAAPNIYEYAGMGQNYSGVTTFAANLEVDNPYVDTTNNFPEDHSLVELTVEAWSGPSNARVRDAVIEVGWVVNPDSNTDTNTRLFTSAFDGATWLGYGHYGSSGFVSYCPGGGTPCGTKQTNEILVNSGGSPLSTNKAFTIEYGLKYGVTAWWVSYDGAFFGYWPTSVFSTSFTSGTAVQIFGETVTNQWNTGGSCSDMFDGTDASLVSDTVGGFAGSATINGSTSGVSMTIDNTKPTAYKARLIGTSFRSMRLTGDGDC